MSQVYLYIEFFVMHNRQIVHTVLWNIWKHLYYKSHRDHGTLTRLLTQLRRLSDAKFPKDNMHACQDALLTIYNGHIVAKACLELGIATADTIPPPTAVIDLKQLAIKNLLPLLKNLREAIGERMYNFAAI